MAVTKKLDARMTLNLPQTTKDVIHKLALEEQISESSFVLRVVNEYLDTSGHEYLKNGYHAETDATN